MDDTQTLGLVASVVRDIGMWAIFAWLYINERRAHDETRRLWLEDLREIANLKPHLRRVEETQTLMSVNGNK